MPARPTGPGRVIKGFLSAGPPTTAGIDTHLGGPTCSTLLAQALRVNPWWWAWPLLSCLIPCFSSILGRLNSRQSLPAACRWALKEPQSEDSVVSKEIDPRPGLRDGSVGQGNRVSILLSHFARQASGIAGSEGLMILSFVLFIQQTFMPLPCSVQI